MLQRILHVGKSVELEKLTGAGQVLAPSVQVSLEVFQLPPQVLLSLLWTTCAHECWIHREVYLQVELKLLADEVLLAESDGHMAAPKGEEVVSFA